MPATIDSAQLHRDIGAVQARLDALEKAQAQNTETLQGIKSRLDELRGGRKALFWLVSAAGTLGAAITWGVKHVTFN